MTVSVCGAGGVETVDWVDDGFEETGAEDAGAEEAGADDAADDGNDDVSDDTVEDMPCRGFEELPAVKLPACDAQPASSAASKSSGVSNRMSFLAIKFSLPFLLIC